MSSTIKRNFQIATAEQMHHFKIVKAGGLMKGRYLKNCYFRAKNFKFIKLKHCSQPINNRTNFKCT